MLTDKDIEKLGAIFATRDDYRRIVREELAPLREMLEILERILTKLKNVGA